MIAASVAALRFELPLVIARPSRVGWHVQRVSVDAHTLFALVVAAASIPSEREGTKIKSRNIPEAGVVGKTET